MKHLTSKIIALVVLLVPVLAFAANPPVIAPTSVLYTTTGYTANFKMTTAPSAPTKLYAAIANVDTNTWVKRDIYLAEVNQNSPVPMAFDVTFNFNDLGIQDNVKYVYYIGGAPTEEGVFYTTSKCFTTGGTVACNGTTTPPANNATVPATTTSNATVPAVVIPQTSVTTPTTTYQAPPMTFGGISITFPRESQVITETSAEIHGIVSALIIIPVELSFVSGKAGSPLGNEQALFSTTLSPGQNQPITMTFTGLSAGTSYYFVLKNKQTNTMSRAIYFTTPGGATNERASFAGQRIGGNGVPDSVVITDTISDKGIVPKCGRTAGSGVPLGETEMCGYKHFLQLVSNVINYALIMLAPIIAVFIMYTGVMIIIYGKKQDPTGAVMAKLKEYKERLGKIAVGILIILFAWIFIATILRELGVKPNYILLDVFSGN
jgi:hypothetical protein